MRHIDPSKLISTLGAAIGLVSVLAGTSQTSMVLLFAGLGLIAVAGIYEYCRHSFRGRYKDENEPGNGIRVSLMGAEGSGKTCFFAGLAHLGEAAKNAPFGIIGRDEPSQRFLNELKEALRRSELPTSTHGTSDLSIDVLYGGCRIAVNAQDFAGEDFRTVGNELKRDAPLFKTLSSSSLLVLFLDIEHDVDAESPINAERLDAALNLLSDESLCDGRRRLAVVITKADLRDIDADVESSETAETYLCEHKPGLATKIEALGYGKRFFFLSPIGRSTLKGGQPPMPAGFEPLFCWIVDNVKTQRRHVWYRRYWAQIVATVAVTVVTLSAWSVRGLELVRANNVLGTDNAEWSVQTNALTKAGKRNALIFAGHVLSLREVAVPKSDTLRDINILRERILSFQKLRSDWTPEMDNRFERLLAMIAEREEIIRVESIKKAYDDSDFNRTNQEISEYYSATVSGTSASKRKSEVDEINSNLKTKEQNDKLENILSIELDKKNPELLLTKCNAILAYLPNLGKTERAEVNVAVNVARSLASGREYEVTVRSASGLAKARRTQVEIDNCDTGFHFATKAIPSREPQWNQSFKLAWTPGNRILVQWFWNSHLGSANTLIAKHEFEDPFCALLDMLSGEETYPGNGGMFHAGLSGEPIRIRFRCEVFPDPVRDRNLFRKYVFPGDFWKELKRP